MKDYMIVPIAGIVYVTLLISFVYLVSDSSNNNYSCCKDIDRWMRCKGTTSKNYRDYFKECSNCNSESAWMKYLQTNNKDPSKNGYNYYCSGLDSN